MYALFITILLLIITPFSFFANAQDTEFSYKTGRFEIETTSAEILGSDVATSFANLLDIDDKIKWSVAVPDKYDPSSPPGIIIHMTEHKLAKMPIGWPRALDEKNMIWISLNKAGQLMPNKEMLLAVLTTPLLQDKYSIDTNRIYIVASANSCRPASAAMQVYPDIFKGVVYSTCEPINWKSDIPETINQMKKNGYVFVASNEKNVKSSMRRSYKKYQKAGITNLEYMNVQKLFYGKNIDRRKLTETIEILDDFD